MSKLVRRAATVALLALALIGACLSPQEAASLTLTSPLIDPLAPLAADTSLPSGADELPGLRTRDTRTYVTDDGTQVTRAYQGSVNYRKDGKWEPIDNTLVPTFSPGYAYRNAANRYLAQFPADIADPVGFSSEGEAITMRLEGARAAGLVDRSTTRFPEALPGVSVDYVVANDALKETLTLAGPQSQSSFRFEVETGDGLAARLNKAGGIDFTKQDGEIAFSFAPPLLQDSSGLASGKSFAARFGLERAAGGYLVTLTADRDWLEAEGRVWPVALDPTIMLPRDGDCTIASDPGYYANCATYQFLFTGAGSSNAYRSLLRFDLSGIPADAEVTEATLGLFKTLAYSGIQSRVGVHAVTKDWSSAANWATTNGTTAWQSPGGDFGSAESYTQIPAGGPSTWYTWPLTALAQRWVSGATPNHGVIAKSDEPSGASDIVMWLSGGWFGSQPYLQVKWKPQDRVSSLPKSGWVADDGSGDVPKVNALESVGDTLYLGGDFGYLGPRTGSFVSIASAGSGSYGGATYQAGYPEVAGIAGANPTGSEVPVRAIAADGLGGWFIGGDFKYVGGRHLERLAHIRSDGTVDPNWRPAVDGSVRSLATTGCGQGACQSVYAGGSFGTVDGQSRAKLAKLDAVTGKLDGTFAPPAPDGDVLAISASSTRLYIGGSFTNLGSYARAGIAAVDLSTGAVSLSWYARGPNSGGLNGSVNSLALSSDKVYAGGTFTDIGGLTRNRIAALDGTSGIVVQTWNPNADGAVQALALSGTRLYVGGTFNVIGGAARHALASLSVPSGAADAWNPNPNGTVVRALAVSGSTVYAAGDFKTIGDQNRRYLAALDANTNGAQATSWNPSMGNDVYAIGVAGGQVYAGGQFRTMNGVVKRNLAAIDTTTGQPTSWLPNPNGVVNAIEHANGAVYVGGAFTSIAGQSRNHVAYVVESTGQLNSWNPSQVGVVSALRASAGYLYVAAPTVGPGDPGTTAKKNAGAFKLENGQFVDQWNPEPNGAVSDIESDGGYVYLGGSFTTVGGMTGRPYLASVSVATGQHSGWPTPSQTFNDQVLDMTLVKNRLYVGGKFTSPRQHLASFTSGNLDYPEQSPAAPNGDVKTVTSDGSAIYVAGSFTTIGGLPRSGLAELSSGGSVATVTPFAPDVDPTASSGGAEALDASPAGLYVGGGHTAVGPASQTGVAFFEGYGRIVEPTNATRTRKRLTIRVASRSGTFSGVRLDYRRTTVANDPWTAVPASTVASDQNQALASWPKSLASDGSTTVVWDVPSTPALAGLEVALEVRAVFVDSNGDAFTSEPVSARLEQKAPGSADAIEPIGPGTVDLLTGNFNLSRDDVSIDAFNSDLTASRSFNSWNYTAGGTSSPLGPGWVSSLPVDAAASEYVSLTSTYSEEEGDVVTITTTDGTKLVFIGFDGQYWPEPGAEDLLLTRVGAEFQVTDLDGNVTVFRVPGGATDGVYRPAEVRQPGSGNTTSYKYRPSDGKVTGIYAPGSDATLCAAPNPAVEAHRKCRFLTLSYSGSPERLDYIELTAYDPNQNPPAFVTNRVAQYSYFADSQRRLKEAWDPRITPSPLKEEYTYDFVGRLASVRVAGGGTWNVSYLSIPGDPNDPTNSGRLNNVWRDTPQGQQNQKIVYQVPLSGSGAPHQMAPSDVDDWGQTDIPTDAVAIFPPDHLPANPPNSSDYEYAQIHYLDAKAREVNIAVPVRQSEAPRGYVTTTEWDAHNNLRRELSAANRAIALAAGSASAQRSQELDTQRTYGADGLELREERGPLHEVKVDGALTWARQLIKTTHDGNFPQGTAPLHLPTTVTVGAEPQGQPGQQLDQRTTSYGYFDDGIPQGLSLRMPTSVTVDPGGLDIKTRTVYRPNGLVAETRMPEANAPGTDAHTEKTYYYLDKDSPFSECNKVEWLDLPCKTKPAAQPGTPTPDLPDLPTTTYRYNRLYQPTQTIEDIGGTTVRTTTRGYDQAGRPTSEGVTATEGLSIPTATVQYNDINGLPASVQTTENDFTKQILRTYDSIGRMVNYEDVFDTRSTMTYDLLGRPQTIDDGKGTQTYGYDQVTGRMESLTDVVPSSPSSPAPTTLEFEASYDADGRITDELLPGGLHAQTTYDETGAPRRLRYVKGPSTWLDSQASESIHGQIVSQSGTLASGSLSSQAFAYDRAGRLAQVQDTAPGQSCVTRVYGFDKDSNRTSLTTRPPSGGACASSGGSTTTYTYDAADRLTNTGFRYDKLGRTLSVPAAHAGGGQDLAMTYFSNDRARWIDQGHGTSDFDSKFELDPARRPSSRSVTFGSGELMHYSDDSDSPSWTGVTDSSSPQWTRPVTGISGDLAVLESQDILEPVTTGLQLSNLHGDIVATASTSPGATGLLSTSEQTEFGVPRQQYSWPPVNRFGWLGAKQRPTELQSGTIAMGVRVYVPQLGRFLQTDPVPGGSANAYDYSAQDPVNEFDLDGECWWCAPVVAVCVRVCSKAVQGIKGALRGAKNVARRAPKPERTPGDGIKGYTRHGLNSAIGRDGHGVHPKAMVNAVRRPLKIIRQSGGRRLYKGRDAAVVLNRRGKVVTTWARSKRGRRR